MYARFAMSGSAIAQTSMSASATPSPAGGGQNDDGGGAAQQAVQPQPTPAAVPQTVAQPAVGGAVQQPPTATIGNGGNRSGNVVIADGADQEMEEAEKPLLYPLQDLSTCLLYTSPSPRDATLSRMPSSA